jgi:hypothetical protein
MEPLLMAEEQSTPQITLDKEKNIFEISGNSLPEDVVSFYAPVLIWLEEYLKQPNQKTEFHFKFLYLNSASSKVILDILVVLEKLVIQGNEVLVAWHYLEMDEDMLSTGKEYEGMVKVPFNFIASM